MATVALSMIVSGDEKPKTLQRCLDSIRKHVDNAYIVITSKDKNNLVKVCKKNNVVCEVKANSFYHVVTKKDIEWLKKQMGYKPIVKAGEKIFQFDKARNYSMKMVKEDWLIWIDTDDVFRGGEKLKELVDNVDKKGVQSVFLNYLYQVRFNKDGSIRNILIEHLRERLIKNCGVYEWVAPIHETLIEKVPTKKIDSKKCDVLHLSKHERMTKALMRNVKILEISVRQTKGKDPRPIYYLGKAYFDLRHDDEKYLVKAEKLFNAYLFGTKEHEGNNKSGWPAERSQCWDYLAEIKRINGDANNAIKCGMNALIECEEYPSTYVSIAMSYLLKKEWSRALFWVKIALQIPEPNTTLIKNPQDVANRVLEVLYHANINLSKLDNAWAAAHKLCAINPESEGLKKRLQFVENIKQERELSKHILSVASHLNKTKQIEKIKTLLMSLPKEVSNNPFMVDLKKKFLPATKHGSKDIAIYCGQGYTTWSPKKLKNPGKSFVGGSEEAVIYLAKELKELGWNITVYGEPGEDEGDHDGVKYLNYYKFNRDDEFNIVIVWRRPDFVDDKLNAKKVYLWAHDIQNPIDYPEKRLSKIDKIIVLSPWHRTNLGNIPDNKIMISSNGVNL